MMIDSSLEVLGQARDYLVDCGADRYVQVIAPFFTSSAGAHMRHILDHYLALMDGLPRGSVDYTVRTRNGVTESQPMAAMAALDAVEAWLQKLDPGDLQQPLGLATEVSVSRCAIALVSTTLGRELVFVASHAIHHYAMIRQIALHQSHPVDAAFGTAPATASYQREALQRTHERI